jgi:hypothetical protein
VEAKKKYTVKKYLQLFYFPKLSGIHWAKFRTQSLFLGFKRAENSLPSPMERVGLLKLKVVHFQSHK